MRYILSTLPVIAILASSSITGCSQNQPGPGYEVSFSCHINANYTLWNTDALSSAKIKPTGRMGVGALSCYASQDPFDDGATLSLAGDGRQLPEYAYLWWSHYPKGNGAHWTSKQKKESNYVITHPQYMARVPIRSEIPESVVQEVTGSPMSKYHPYVPRLLLHLYLTWTKEGVQMTWAEQDNDTYPVIKYGGYLPKPLAPRVVNNLHKWKAEYMPPPPGALPPVGVIHRVKNFQPVN